MSFPDRHIAGDTLEWPVSVPDFPPSAGWTLTYWFAPRFTTPVQAAFSIACVAVTATDSYSLQATPTTTAAWVPGMYNWWRRVTKSGAAQTLDDLLSRGVLQILQDPSTAVQGFDNRTQAQKAVADLKEALSVFRASGGVVKSYTIGERQITFSDEVEILSRLSFWQAQLSSEDKAARLAAGMKNPRNVYVRMDRL